MALTSLSLRMPSLPLGLSPEDFVSQFLSARGLNKSSILNARSLSQITPPFSLAFIEKACSRLILALENQEIIGILSDHDCDGQTSCAVIYSVLTEVFLYPKERILIFIGHRTEEGYGITDKLTARILSQETRPSVMITADCGSSDEKNIGILQAHGIDIIVTDHHQIPPAGPPASAYAVINPQQKDCLFPDKKIAGCAVAWLVMCAWRARFMEKNQITLSSMAPYLDYVAIGTLSDCVSLTQSMNNRIFLRYGLERIRKGARPCWRVLKHIFPETVDCEFLTFKVIPLLNADGRLSDALGGVSFLTAQDMVSAQEQLAILMETNSHRKHLQKIQLHLAQGLVEVHEHAQILNLGEKGHHGIHGVTASRLLEEHQKSTVIFSQIDSPSEEPILSGSARGLEGQCLKTILDRVHEANGQLMLRYGGHAQAAGVSIYAKNFLAFKKSFLEHYKQTYETQAYPEKELRVDAILPSPYVLNESWLQQVESLLEPFGKDFKKPLLGIWGKLVEGRVLGADKNHLQIHLQIEGGPLKAMLFFCPQAKDFLNGQESLESKLWIGELSLETYKKNSQYVFMLKGVFDPVQSTWSTATVLGAPACLKPSLDVKSLAHKKALA